MTQPIIGRLQEQEVLQDLFYSNKSEFVAVYGRRRVGKTYLIRNYFRSQKCIYFQVVGLQNGTFEQQLQNFSNSISETFYDNIPLRPSESWKEAFQNLTSIITKKIKKNKIILFFDELPWMATARSGLLEALDYFWNKYWVDYNNLKLIICGSTASWILKNIIYDKGSLHNRVTRQIILRSFTLNETKYYLESMGCKFDNNQILEIYIAIGGIPFYLNGVTKRLSATQNINNLCFRKEGLLFSEFDKLFKSLFNEAEAYIELIRIIAQKLYGISRPDLEKKCKLSQKGGTMTERLKALEEAGFIISFVPISHKTRGIYYKVIDEFTLFYLTWMEPEKNTLIKAESRSNFWKFKYKTPRWSSWSGYAFEAVCYKHIDLIRKKLDIPEGSRAGVWKSTSHKDNEVDGAQIDLLFDRNDNVITLCEIKYSNLPFTITKQYAKNLINKQQLFLKKTGENKQVFVAMITSNGIKDNFYAEDLISSVMTLDDFFKC